MQIMNLPIFQLQQKIPQDDLSFHSYETLKKQKTKKKQKKNNDYSSRETQITPHSHGVEKKGYFMLPYASLKNSFEIE